MRSIGPLPASHSEYKCLVRDHYFDTVAVLALPSAKLIHWFYQSQKPSISLYPFNEEFYSYSMQHAMCHKIQAESLFHWGAIKRLLQEHYLWPPKKIFLMPWHRLMCFTIWKWEHHIIKYGIDRCPRWALFGNSKILGLLKFITWSVLKISKICLVKFFRLLIQGFSQEE